MVTVTIPQKEYADLVKRQKKIERELKAVKHLMHSEFDETRIRTDALHRWDRISRDLDKGDGHFFSSMKDMRKWLQAL